MDTIYLKSPILTGNQNDARRFLDSSDVPADLNEITVVLDGHNTLAATTSFADELVRILMVERRAKELVVTMAGEQFTRWILEAAAHHGVSGNVKHDN